MYRASVLSIQVMYLFVCILNLNLFLCGYTVEAGTHFKKNVKKKETSDASYSILSHVSLAEKVKTYIMWEFLTLQKRQK